MSDQGVFNYTVSNEFFAYASKHNYQVRCYNLVCFNELPNWLTNPDTRTNATLVPVLENHIKSLVAYFGDRCYCSDVVNEAVSDRATGILADNST
jgi:endo-1,4-beta-xylanase